MGGKLWSHLTGITERVICPNTRGRSPHAKLTDDNVREIFALRESKITLDSIAKKFSVSKSVIEKLLRREHYKDMVI